MPNTRAKTPEVALLPLYPSPPGTPALQLMSVVVARDL